MSKTVKVLLIDDQPMIANAIKEMIKEDEDIEFHYCQDPSKAMERAEQIAPTVILQDLVMPEIDGLMLVRYFRANPLTKDVPLIVLSTKEQAHVKADAFALGANDYMVKLPDKVELIARLRYHSSSYTRLLERNEAYDKLHLSQEALLFELAEAAEYVRTQLPRPLDKNVQADWRFIPSAQLGGDAFGYRWIDQTHFALYLLDVCGHGVGAALLSITLMNVLHGSSNVEADFSKPDEVLTALNRDFQMERHNNMFFTMWYGVYNSVSGILTYSCGGHPPAILLLDGEVHELAPKGFVIGGLNESVFKCEEIKVMPGSRLYLFSDGVFEILRSDGQMMHRRDFVEILKKEEDLDAIVDAVKKINQGKPFDDDFSLLKLSFR